MKVLGFAGSLRKDSLNKQLLRTVAKLSSNVDFEIVDLKPLEIPLYDGDIEASSGVPASVKMLADKISAADALVICSPEYNGGISCVTKNTVDWLSRLKPVSLTGKPMLLFAASPGALGGVRTLWHTRVPFEVLGTIVHPDMFGLPKADTAFDGDKFKEEKTQQRVQDLLNKFYAFAEKLKN
jgi:chromate reductase